MSGRTIATPVIRVLGGRDLAINVIVTPIKSVVAAESNVCGFTPNGWATNGTVVVNGISLAAKLTNQLLDVLLHEIGHVLGFGSSPRWKALVRGAGSPGAKFVGPVANGVWNAVIPDRLAGSVGVPVIDSQIAAPLEDRGMRRAAGERCLKLSETRFPFRVEYNGLAVYYRGLGRDRAATPAAIVGNRTVQS